MFALILLLLPITLAVISLIYLVKRSQLWLEAFAAITSAMLLSYGLIFWAETQEIQVFKIVGILSVAQFFAILLFPIASPTYYQKFNLKSVLFDSQSSLSSLLKHIRSSRFLSSVTVFLFFVISFGWLFYTLGFIHTLNQALWMILLSAGVAVINAVNWKSSQF